MPNTVMQIPDFRPETSYMPIYILGEDGVQNFCEVFLSVAE